MPKITVDDLRKDYEKLTGKKASVNWNKAQIQKKMKLFQAEKQIDAEQQRPKTKDQRPIEPNPEFEKMLDSDKISSSLDSGYNPDIPDQPQAETRGGFREGAGRPFGQTEERSRCERLLKLEKPDIAVQKILQGLNLALGKATGVPFSFDQVDEIALGVTLPLYYWFPSMEGRAGVFTLHCVAAEKIVVPFMARNITLKQYQADKLKKQQDQAAADAAAAVQVNVPPVIVQPVVSVVKPVTPKKKSKKVKK